MLAEGSLLLLRSSLFRINRINLLTRWPWRSPGESPTQPKCRPVCLHNGRSSWCAETKTPLKTKRIIYGLQHQSKKLDCGHFLRLAVDTAVDEGRNKMENRVARAPARLCNRQEALLFSTPRVRLSCFVAQGFLLFLFLSVLTPVCFSRWCCFVRAAVICPSSASVCVLFVSSVFCLTQNSLCCFASYFL